MEEKTIYKNVLKKVSDTIVNNEVEVSFCNYKDNFSVMLFDGTGDDKVSVYNGYFDKKDSNKSLEAKCAGFVAMVKYLVAP